MTMRTLLLLGGATAVLWVVPSFGTQGMGTIGAHIAHVDAMLFDAVPAERTAARAMLAHTDGGVETAIGL